MTVHISPATIAESEALVARWQDRFPKIRMYLNADAAPTRALRYLGLALWQEGNVEEAAKVLLNASYWDPDNATILAELGSATLAAGRSEEAMSHFIASLERDGSQLQVWLNLGYLCKAAGNIEFATRCFEKALTIEPLSSEAVAGLGMIHFEAGEYARASALLQASVDRGVSAPAVDACLGQALYLQGLFTEARIAFQRAALACPQEQKILTKFAETCFVETVIFGSVDDAVAGFRDLLGDDRQRLEATSRNAFQLCCAFGHGDAAQRLGAEILREQPGDAMVRYHLEALTGQKHDRAPRDYLVACFDHYAP